MASNVQYHRLFTCFLVVMGLMYGGSALFLRSGSLAGAVGVAYLAAAAYHTYRHSTFRRPEPALQRIH